MKRYKAGDISCSEAMEEIQALIMSSETIGELELTHEAMDKLKDSGASDF